MCDWFVLTLIYYVLWYKNLHVCVSAFIESKSNLSWFLQQNIVGPFIAGHIAEDFQRRCCHTISV